MARKQTQEPPAPPKLVVPRDEARRKIEVQIAKGQELATREIDSAQALQEADHRYHSWKEYNRELLLRSFDNASIAHECWRDVMYAGSALRLPQAIAEFRDDLIHPEIRCLQSVIERLDLIPEAPGASSTSHDTQAKPVGRRAFVVHGRDNEARLSVARFLEKLDLDVVILQEQPGGMRTLIEKFERHAVADFAVVILTPDDEGRLVGSADPMEPRARQNVIFELGYLVANLGRDHVCALLKGGMKWPSDIQGVQYLDMDGSWEIALAKEIRAAGLDVDLNRLV